MVAQVNKNHAWTLRWGDYIMTLGYDTILIDSFNPRGYKHRKEVGWDCALNDQLEDLKAAITFAKDNKPIYLIGFSLGGYTALKALTDNWNHQIQQEISGTILFYTPCQDFIGSELVSNLLIISGGKDLRAPASDCQRLVNMSPNKDNLRHVILPEATHGFDIQ